ncbi:OLC1v1015016C2 [Oldenlandia corymbosa var. corymbosa]|uniref:OLC1v1015016C2 n=1 Tax=Oldenlandia corymbosa var. corymbosa TaxID=529605 RepID=A0AAV1E4F3_OLDCO|nr:OLC1v1015016C2 [Oldenlandia corymbosa var. corymbosa]
MDAPESSSKSSIKGRKRGVKRPLRREDVEPVTREDVEPLTRDTIVLREDGSFDPDDPEFEKGTTAIAFVFKDGIMVAVDHSSKSLETEPNIVQLNSHMLATISGGCEFLLKDLQEKCYVQEQKEGKKTSAAEVLNWLAETLSAYEEEPLSIGILIAVWNESERCVYCMNGYGEVDKGDVLATGSGSVSSVLVVQEGRGIMPVTQAADVATGSGSGGRRRHSGSRRKPSMSVPEAAELAKKAICIAAHNAPHYGDVVTGMFSISWLLSFLCVSLYLCLFP